MMRSMSLRFLRGLVCSLLILPSMAMAAPATGKALVLVMGSFHFANPGLDAVKAPVTDVTTPAHQAWLDGLAMRIAAFAPTDVLVECEASEQATWNARLADYRAGKGALGINELAQVGMRVARAAGVEQLTCFDQREVHWNGAALMDFMKEHDVAGLAALQATFQALSAREAEEHARLSLGELLRLANSPERDRENRSLYLLTNAVDAGASYAGADAASSWWRRNFHMYGNVQKAAQPGRRVFVLAGAGHTAVLRELLASDPAREAVDIAAYLAD